MNAPVVAIASKNGLQATRLAFEQMRDGVDTLEAVVAGVGLVEDDPNETSVGLGGLPNENGDVELDAAVMHGPTHAAGGVAANSHIRPLAATGAEGVIIGRALYDGRVDLAAAIAESEALSAGSEVQP